MQEGDRWAAQEQWPEALAAYERAERLEPGHPDLVDRITRARQQIAQEQLASARRSLQAEDFEGALVKLGEAMHHWPENRELEPLREQITTRVLALARDQLQAGQHQASLDTLGILQRHRPDLPQLMIRRQEITQSWAREARQRARRDEEEGLPHAAFARYALAASLSQDPEDAQARDRLRESILAPARWRLALDLQGDEARVAPLRKRIFQAVSQGRQIEPVAQVDPKLPGARVSASLGSATCQQESQSEVATHRYVSGSRQVENPDWRRQWDIIRSCEEDLIRAEEQLDRRVDVLLRAENELVRAEENQDKDLDRYRRPVLDARRDVRQERREVQRQRAELNAARVELARIPSFLEEETLSDFHYEVKLWTRSCEVPWRVVGAASNGEPHVSFSRVTSSSTQDRAHAAYVRFAISEDPLRFPSGDLELIQVADQDIADQVAQYVVQLFEEDRKNLMVLADKLSTHDPENSMLVWMRIWLLDPAHSPEAGQLLKERYQLPNPWILTSQPR